MSDKNIKIICIVLAVIIAGLLIRSATNKGKLWDGQENYGRDPRLWNCGNCVNGQQFCYKYFSSESGTYPCP